MDIPDYNYGPIGYLVRTSLPNGVVETHNYDVLNRLLKLENKKDTNTLTGFTYTLNNAGMRTSVTEQDGRKVDYKYDNLYRLTEEKITDAVNGNKTIGFVMDAVGNRLSKTDNGVVTSYVYDENDRLLAETTNGQTKTYTYDAKGNTIGESKAANDKTDYIWDDKGRLIQATITTPSGTKIVTYKYNENNIRVSQTIDGVETKFLLDSNRDYPQVLEEYNNSGVQVSYVYGLDLISQTRSGVTSFYLYDGLGSVRALSDRNGVVSDRYNYNAYGNLISVSGTSTNNYRFTGEQLDSATGDYYLRDRYYGTDIGRFTRSDVFEGTNAEPLTLHKYLYTHDNPVNAIDPSGLATMQEGNDVHNLIGAAFITQIGIPLTLPLNPLDSTGRKFDANISRVFDPRFPLNILNIISSGAQNRPTVKRVVRTAYNNPNHPGIPGLNGKVPDLVDFMFKEFYEIKPNNSQQITDATNKLNELELGFHSIELTEWHKGITFAPPPLLLVSNGNFAIPRTHSPGLIVYDIIDSQTIFRSFYIISRVSSSIFAELVALTSAAAARSSRTFGYA